MRKYHRWLAIVFGAFLLVISASGLALHALDILGGAGPGGRPRALAGGQGAPGAVTAGAPLAAPGCPIAKPRPRPSGPKVFIMHLHSGELFGPVGTALSILSGLALFFFAFSGLWMYIQMFRNRKGSNAGKWFW